MEALALSNPIVVIVCTLVVVFIGKFLFISKDTGNALKKDSDNADHELQITFVKGIGEMSEKMRIIQNEIMKDVDEKYFTKEMAKRHDERISKAEENIQEILPRMQKIDIIYEMVKELQHEKHVSHINLEKHVNE